GAFARGGGGGVQAGEFQNGGEQIHKMNGGVVGAPGIHDLRTGDDKRHLDATLVERALATIGRVRRLKLVVHGAVVTEENDVRVVGIHDGEEPRHLRVH